MVSSEQLGLAFPNTRGGRRPGAGRPRGSRTSSAIPHTRRPGVSPHTPIHVTVRVTRGTWNLRSQRCFRPVAAAFERALSRTGFRIVHFSVQHDHIHMIIEADDRRTMSNELRALLSRVARGLNAVMGASGRRFADRYHEHVLKTPREVRNAVRYVVGNRAHHEARRGRTVNRFARDEFSSIVQRLVSGPRSWLLREGWTGAEPPD